MTVQTKRGAARRRPLGQVLADWPIWVHQARMGRLLGRGYAIVCTSGRRTGQPRRAGVVVLREDRAARTLFVLAGSRTSHWYRNLTAGSRCEIWIGCDRFIAGYRILSDVETLEVLAWYRSHRRFQARMQAIFFGWTWTADAAAMGELVKSAVVGVAFKPLA